MLVDRLRPFTTVFITSVNRHIKKRKEEKKEKKEKKEEKKEKSWVVVDTNKRYRSGSPTRSVEYFSFYI